METFTNHEIATESAYRRFAIPRNAWTNAVLRRFWPDSNTKTEHHDVTYKSFSRKITHTIFPHNCQNTVELFLTCTESFGRRGQRIRGFEGARTPPKHGSAPSHC